MKGLKLLCALLLIQGCGITKNNHNARSDSAVLSLIDQTASPESNLPDETLSFGKLSSITVSVPETLWMQGRIYAFSLPSGNGMLLAWEHLYAPGPKVNTYFTKVDNSGARISPDVMLADKTLESTFASTPSGFAILIDYPPQVIEFDQNGDISTTITLENKSPYSTGISNAAILNQNGNYFVTYNAGILGIPHMAAFVDEYDRSGKPICYSCVPMRSHGPRYPSIASNGIKTFFGGGRDLGSIHWVFDGFLMGLNNSYYGFRGYDVSLPDSNNSDVGANLDSSNALPLPDGFILPITHRRDNGGLISDTSVKVDIGTVKITNSGLVEPTKFITNTPNGTEQPGPIVPFDGGFLVTWIEHSPDLGMIGIADGTNNYPSMYMPRSASYVAMLDAEGNATSGGERINTPLNISLDYGYLWATRGNAFTYPNGDVGWAAGKVDFNKDLFTEVDYQVKEIIVTRITSNGSGGVTPVPSISPLPPVPPVPSDTTAPVVSIASPLDGVVLRTKQKLSIQAMASDDVAVSQVRIYVNGKLLCADSSTPYSCSWSVPGKRGAKYRLTAQANDASGNTGMSTTVSVTAE